MVEAEAIRERERLTDGGSQRRDPRVAHQCQLRPETHLVAHPDGLGAHRVERRLHPLAQAGITGGQHHQIALLGRSFGAEHGAIQERDAVFGSDRRGLGGAVDADARALDEHRAVLHGGQHGRHDVEGCGRVEQHGHDDVGVDNCRSRIGGDVGAIGRQRLGPFRGAVPHRNFDPFPE
ncbi:hypothetical protein SBI80_26065 [Mycolicibacterium sp. 050158]|nr:hypothetical protein [Mycolicibacterium sp. 050158]MDX1893066.1 hypothetical protein [Mycolicibacterium sp. 050158]